MNLERVNRWIPRAAWANLVVQIGIVVTGGAVRLTGSGLGCSTWPNCEPGQFVPQVRGANDLHGLIEFANRTLAGVVLVTALSLMALLLSRAHYRPAQRRRGLEGLSVAIVVTVIAQAVLGGMTVWFELHPMLVGSHFLLSGVLVAASAYLVARLPEGDAPPRALHATGLVPLRPLAIVLALVTVVLVVLGVVVTGAGPHSGDENVGYRFAVDPAAMARVHAGAAWVFTALVVVLAVLLHRAKPEQPTTTELTRARTRTWVLLAVTAAQGGIGYVQYFTGLPEVLVGLHLLGAVVLIAAVVFTITGLRVREADATEVSAAATEHRTDEARPNPARPARER